MDSFWRLAVTILSMSNLLSVSATRPCSFSVKGANGVIDYKTVMKEEKNCSQVITAPPYHKIVLNFTAFNFVSGSGRIEIYDGSDKNQSLLWSYTGTKSSFIVQSTGRYLFLVVIKTDPMAISNFTAVFSYIATKAKPRILLPSRLIRAFPEHFVWCSSEGTPPINMSLMNSSTTLASGVGMVWSKIDHDGNYTCIATNTVGTESKTFQVSLIGKIIASVWKSPAATRIIPNVYF
ncbi:PREDICTED: uncharacterized protein LOC107350396 isoform X2 [Acropora digitifera]|uniref:uncharacterized protein LOC107350396 isoform X2 n=1 Tax=Acropora digitifera TaxID=70779 RepID=UPI00077AA0A7|nr:PREDICTED: uncharacterized protein LOC107350396 isoform X2 [Acropora digitifera]